MNYAKVALTGRLTKEPTQKTWNDTLVVSFSMAVSNGKKDGDKYLADFYNVSVWGKSAEFILPRLSKGTLVQVYGDLTLQSYEDKKTKQERQGLAVKANEVFVLGPFEKKDEKKEEEGAFPF